MTSISNWTFNKKLSGRHSAYYNSHAGVCAHIEPDGESHIWLDLFDDCSNQNITISIPIEVIEKVITKEKSL